MKPETREILNDPDLVRIRDDYLRRMEDVFDGRNDGSPPFVLSGMSPGVELPEGATIEEAVHGVLDVLAAEADALRDPRVFRPLSTGPTEHGEDRTHSLVGDAYADLQKQKEPRFLTTPVGSLEPGDLEKSPSWRNMKRSTEIFLEAEVALPLFTCPAITGPILEAVSLYGAEKFLLAMLDHPDAARHDLQAIADVAVKMRKWFVKHVPHQQLTGIVPRLRAQPPGYGQIDGCTTQLLGPDLYRDLVGPCDDQLLSVYPKGGMIHICGWHTQHIPFWREMKSLKVLQLSGDAMPQLARYFSELRDDQLVYVSPHAAMSLSGIMEITRGRRVIIALYPKDLHRVPTEIDGHQYSEATRAVS